MGLCGIEVEVEVTRSSNKELFEKEKESGDRAENFTLARNNNVRVDYQLSKEACVYHLRKRTQGSHFSPPMRYS